jgi:hypothetical protein
MGAVEPSWENAMEPLEHDTEGDSGPGLEFLLEFCDVEMVDRRFIQDVFRAGKCNGVSGSSTSLSGV